MAATYTVGASDLFFTAASLRADARTLNAQVQALDGALDGNEAAPQDWWDSWLAWLASWTGFFHDNYADDGILAGFELKASTEPRDRLVSYENQFLDWSKQAATYGAHIPGAVVQPGDPSSPTPLGTLANDLIKLVIASLVAFALFEALK